MPEKWLYCPKCRVWPEVSAEAYEKVEEMREWDGDCYALVDSNFDEQEAVALCGECRTELECREKTEQQQTLSGETVPV